MCSFTGKRDPAPDDATFVPDIRFITPLLYSTLLKPEPMYKFREKARYRACEKYKRSSIFPPRLGINFPSLHYALCTIHLGQQKYQNQYS